MDNKAELPQGIPETIVEEFDPLRIELSDSDLVKAINDRLTKSETFYTKIDLKGRREKNKDFRFGRQIDLTQVKKGRSAYIDNLIYEAEGTIKPIALSRIPDLFVKPSQDASSSRDMAKNITKVINSDIRRRENRRVLGLAFSHMPVYFQGVIKAYWDPLEGTNGNYKYKVVHPERITLDHTATTNDPEDMDVAAEDVEMTVKEALMRFPKAKEQLLKQMGIVDESDENQKKMSSVILVKEVWFKWYKEGKDEEGKSKPQEIECVAWKFKDIILDKMLNPYYDYEGKEKLVKDLPGNPKPQELEIAPEEMQDVLIGNIPVKKIKIYNNFFTRPQKPYIFLNYDLWGEYPLDATSRIEQSIPLQVNINKRGAQITDANDTARGKHIFSTASGLDKKEIKQLDLANPEQDLMVKGSIDQVHRFIPGSLAQPGLFTEINLDRQRLFAKMGTNATTRGEHIGDETVGGKQMLREADFGKIDDMVEDTINYAAEKMAAWSLQFIRMFWTKERTIKILGPDGEVEFAAINQDSVEDGMEVTVSASGVDKMMAKREAYERARMQLTDPLTFFIDVGASDPKGRTEKLMLFTASPELYLQKFVEGLDSEGMGQKLNQQPVDGAGAPPAASGGMAPPAPPTMPTGASTAQIGGGSPPLSSLPGYGSGNNGFMGMMNSRNSVV